MDKQEKIIGNIRKCLIVLIIILLIFTFGYIIFSGVLINYDNQEYIYSDSSRSVSFYPCLKKGSVCSRDDIYHSIKVSFLVNNSQTYEFYLLSNDSDTATFIMSENLVDDVNWHNERINMKGPTNVFRVLSDSTSTWSSIPVISSYEYSDYGQVIYENHCSDENYINHEDYDCSRGDFPSRGYKGLKIENGALFIQANLYSSEGVSMMNGTLLNDPLLRARIPTYEEIYDLEEDGVLPDWLMDHLYEKEGFWTMSSSTLPSTGYIQGVFAVERVNRKATLMDVYSMNNANDYYTHTGIRPVITIEKV